MAKHNQTPGIRIHPPGTMPKCGGRSLPASLPPAILVLPMCMDAQVSQGQDAKERPCTLQDAQEPPVPEAARVPVSPRIPSIALLNGARELVIEHAGEEYRLRLTSKGKLILTK